MTAETESPKTLEKRALALFTSAGAILMIVSTPFLMWWDGYVLAHLWAWFVVTLGAPAISVWQAVGLAVIWNHFRASAFDMKRENPTSWERLAHATIEPAVALLVGYLVKALALS